MMKRPGGVLKGLTTLALSVTTLGTACADVLNLTSAGADGVLNEAYFVQIDPQSTGTGVIDSFVEISGAGNADITEAYNTTVNDVLQNGSADNFNRYDFAQYRADRE